MSTGLEFIEKGMSFQEMLAKADEHPVTRRAFIAAVGVALAAGVTLKPEEAEAWNSYNSKISGPLYSAAGLADCVHEDITQIAYAYALHKMYRSNGTIEVTKKNRNGSTYTINVPDVPGGLLNPWRPHDGGENGQAPSFSDTDLAKFGNYDPLPNSMYAENVAFLRMGAFWNDSACDSIADFMFNYARKDQINNYPMPYSSVADVASHILSDQENENEYFLGSALIKFSMGERASFIHAMQAFLTDATTPLPQGKCRQMMMQWLGVAWEFARTGDPNNIEVEGLSKDECRTIFDAFIDLYHQCYKGWDIRDQRDKCNTPVCENMPLEDLFSVHGDGDKFACYGHPESVDKEKNDGYSGPNPLNIRGMECRSIPMSNRSMRLRALGMFAHTIEDSWCPSHCSRAYPIEDTQVQHETPKMKHQILAFNHYYRQKGSGTASKNRHSPYDQVCKVDLNSKPWKGNSKFDNKNNLRQILTYNPDSPWYKFWDFCDWFPDRYNFSRGTNKLYNFAPGEANNHKYRDSSKGIEYEIFNQWYFMETLAGNKDIWTDFSAAGPVRHNDAKFDFMTLGMSEAINTMTALFQLFMQDKPWNGENGEKGVRDWLLENTLKCAFKDDDEDMYNGTYPIKINSGKALKASSWICTGGRRSLDSGRLLLVNVASLSKKYAKLGIADKSGMKYGLKDPCSSLQLYVLWEDWAAKFFNEYNDGTAQCKKHDNKGFDEDDGMTFVKNAHQNLSACLDKAVEINGEDKVNEIVGSSEMLALRQVLTDLAGVYNEFLIQKTDAVPTDENILSTLATYDGADAGALGSQIVEETALIEAIPSSLQGLFATTDSGDDDEEEEEVTTDLLVSIQAIGSPQVMDLSTNIEPDDDADEYRPYMFTNQKTLSPFSAWAKVGSAVDDQLLTYGEKGDGITVSLRFFADNVYGDDYECEVVGVDNKRSEDNAYRVFGQVLLIEDDSLMLNVHTLNTDGEHVTNIYETFPFEEGFDHEELDAIESGSYVNLLLRQTPESDTKEIQGFAVIDTVTTSESNDDFFNELNFTNITNAPIYDVFSNSVSIVSGEIDPSDGSIAAPHFYAYYQEGASEDVEYTDKYVKKYNEETGEYETLLASYNEETGLWEEDENGEPLVYYKEASNTSFTLVSTVSYEQGVMCDIPLQCDTYDEEVESTHTLSALVYQDNSIQDTENMQYKTHFTKGAPSEDADEPQFEEVEQFNDPLYLSYLAVGMCDDHADACELPQHHVSDEEGKHFVLCDDFIVHGIEDCTDEDGNLCTESGKPCTKCNYHAAVRLYGETRYETMAAIVGTGFESADTVVVASGQNFPDALSASALAGAFSAPIVLTTPEALSAEAAAEITRLGANSAIIVGGTAAVSAEAASAIDELGLSVERVSGETREATAREVAAAVTAKTGGSKTYIVVSGQNFPDALAIAPFAYAKCAPILLTGADGSLDADSLAAIPAGAEVVVCGGTAAGSAATILELTLGHKLVRLAGETRYETAAKIAAFEIEQGMSCNLVAIATGENFPDALAGAAFAGANDGILVLAKAAESPAVDTVAEVLGGQIDRCFVYGGEAAVTDDTAEAIATKFGLDGLNNKSYEDLHPTEEEDE